MKNIYNVYTGNNNFPNLFNSISRYGTKPNNPVILLYDNEKKRKKPLNELLNYTNTKDRLSEKLYFNLVENLYVATIPLVKGLDECEIEDLFDEFVLSTIIEGKSFDRKGKNGKNTYSKSIFASYVTKNYKSISFEEFRPLLDAFSSIIDDYSNK